MPAQKKSDGANVGFEEKLWLVDKDGKLDYAAPIELTPPPLVTNEIVPFGGLLTFLQEKAKSKVAAGRDAIRL